MYILEVSDMRLKSATAILGQIVNAALGRVGVEYRGGVINNYVAITHISFHNLLVVY